VASGAKDLVQLTPSRVLEDEDDALFVVEPSEQAEHVGVVESSLDLNLAAQVGVEPVLLQLRLVRHLERHHVAALDHRHAQVSLSGAKNFGGKLGGIGRQCFREPTFFSRARYTLPNLPSPMYLPISKSDMLHSSLGAAVEHSSLAAAIVRESGSRERGEEGGGRRIVEEEARRG
jgi:hypothetical protein